MALQHVKKSVPMKVRKAPKIAVAQSTQKSAQGVVQGEVAVVAIGRRKTATARVRLFHGGSTIIVNNKPAAQYFAAVDPFGVLVSRAFKATNTAGTLSCTAKATGSGMSAQLEAVVFGIARALVKLNTEHKSALRKAGLLTRDDRMKESRKVGKGGRARKEKQSPKR